MDKFIVIQKRNFYAGTLNYNRGWTVTATNEYNMITAETKAVCRKELAKITARTYYLSNGEYSSPKYRIVKIGGRFHVAAKNRSAWMW